MANRIAPHRRGAPRPLILYLQAALGARSHAIATVGGTDPAASWLPDLREAALDLAAETSQADVLSEATRSMMLMLDGIDRYQRHPYRRPPPHWPVAMTAGSTRLYDFGGAGRPCLIIPSLVNRAYILDLLPGPGSFLERLTARGLRPFLLDWGELGRKERGFSLGDYITHRLIPAFDAIHSGTGTPPATIGYCMGGTLALALATERPTLSDLALIGAPWDFAATRGVATGSRTRLGSDLAPIIDSCNLAFGCVPSELFQQIFATIAPMQAVRKFTRFAAETDIDRVARFVALEDWLNDPVHVSTAVARDVLIGWYGDNTPANGQWTPLKQPIDPGKIAARTLVISGQRDHICPPQASHPLVVGLPQAEALDIATGHVGLIASAQSSALVADRICRWMTL